jgi:ATP-dependent Lon protease
MSASRWHSNIIDFFDWLGDSEVSLEELFLPSLLTRVTKKDLKKLVKEPPVVVNDETMKYPGEIPILPLRGVVVFPQTAVPLTIGQARSIKLVDDVSGGERLIGLVASRKPDLENPEPEDLYSVGTIAVIHRLFRAPDNTIRLLVQGLVRFKLVEIIQKDPYYKATIELIPEEIEMGLEIDALARNARDQFEQIAELNQSIPRELAASITTLEDPLQTVYTISNFQRIELAEAQKILELDSTKAKLHKLIGFLVREGEVLHN